MQGKDGVEDISRFELMGNRAAVIFAMIMAVLFLVFIVVYFYTNHHVASNKLQSDATLGFALNFFLTMAVTCLVASISIVINDYAAQITLRSRISQELAFFQMVTRNGVRGLISFDLDLFLSGVTNGDEIFILDSTPYDERTTEKIEAHLRENPETRCTIMFADPESPMIQARAYDICQQTDFQVFNEDSPNVACFPNPKRTRRQHIDTFIRDHRNECEKIRSLYGFFRSEAEGRGERAKSRLQYMLLRDFFGLTLYMVKPKGGGGSLYIGFFLHDSGSKLPFLRIVDTGVFPLKPGKINHSGNDVFSFKYFESYFCEKWDKNLMMVDPQTRSEKRYRFMSPGIYSHAVTSIKHVFAVDYNNSGQPSCPQF